MAAWGLGIEGTMRGLAVDLAPIRVNMVRLGAVHTELFGDISEERLPAVLQRFKDASLLGKVGTPEEVAEAYIYAMKDSFVTGSAIARVNLGEDVKKVVCQMTKKQTGYSCFLIRENTTFILASTTLLMEEEVHNSMKNHYRRITQWYFAEVKSAQGFTTLPASQSHKIVWLDFATAIERTASDPVGDVTSKATEAAKMLITNIAPPLLRTWQRKDFLPEFHSSHMGFDYEL
ncbi:MAG: hypothetical protein MMC33_010252 [Icmadophila ericetorum]|nr:hypothetical protein [Icmadophila ericetorum]